MKILNFKSKKKQNNALSTSKKRVMIQAALAMSTIAVTIVLLFAMTQAWYTNVIQSGGLVFQTQQWGFTGQVTIGPAAVVAEPGDVGVIELDIVNDSSEMVMTSVSISKARMTSEMQKRLFFYADTSVVKNGEICNRVYLNRQQSYSYLIFGNEGLHLSQNTHNDVPLKWEWVYDMLGYYCMGTVTDTEQIIEDFLRPVSYDLDLATFAKDPGDPNSPAKLETVDGTTTAAQFIQQLYDTDGYAGNTVGTPVAGYYPVQVDESGYGVWVYLCNYAEIELATQFDTQLVRQEEPRSEQVMLTVVSENSQVAEQVVSKPEDLKEALSSGTAGIITLEQDIRLEGTVTVKPGNTVLDLNGHTLETNVTGTNSAIHVGLGSDLTVINGRIQGSGEKTVGFTVEDGQLTMSDVSVTNVNFALRIADNVADSTVRLSNCTLESTNPAIHIKGNGDETGQKTQLIVEGCTIRSDYAGIMGVGNADPAQYATDIQIINSEISGLYVAVYHPQKNSTLSISGSKLSGITGIAIKGGTVYIADSTIEGLGTADKIVTPYLEKNGFVDTGAGISVETVYGYDISVTVTGNSKITSVAQTAVLVFEDTAENYFINLQGGVYSSDVSQFLSADYVCTPQADGTYLVGKKNTE